LTIIAPPGGFVNENLRENPALTVNFHAEDVFRRGSTLLVLKAFAGISSQL
jgi:hypothetical protein